MSDRRTAALRSFDASFVVFAIGVAALVVMVLLFDGPSVVRQCILGSATAAALVGATLIFRIPMRQIACAVAVATCGEVLLSVLWGLYSYRSGGLPFYVPPGHGVFYALAAVAARQPWLERNAAAIQRAILIAGSALAIISLIFWNDVWGAIWWIAAAALMIRARRPVLLSTCFLCATFLEWGGTALGNWHWLAIVPGLSIPSANPPAGVGLLYVLLDFVVTELVGDREAPALPVGPAIDVLAP